MVRAGGVRVFLAGPLAAGFFIRWVLVMAYADTDDLLARFDQRVLGDLASVDGEQVTPAALAADPRVLAALDDASGEIDSAVRVAGRYTADDLAGLTGTGLAHLKRITCDIAFWLLIDRRCLVNIVADEADRRNRIYREHLKDLREGREIFDVATARTSALPSQALPTTVELVNNNTIAGRARGHFYPGYVLPNNR